MVTKRLWQFYWGASGTKMKGGQHMWQHFGDFWVRAMLGSEWNPSGKPHSDCHRFPLRQQRFFKAVCNSAKALREREWICMNQTLKTIHISHDSSWFSCFQPQLVQWDSEYPWVPGFWTLWIPLALPNWPDLLQRGPGCMRCCPRCRRTGWTGTAAVLGSLVQWKDMDGSMTQSHKCSTYWCRNVYYCITTIYNLIHLSFNNLTIKINWNWSILNTYQKTKRFVAFLLPFLWQVVISIWATGEARSRAKMAGSSVDVSKPETALAPERCKDKLKEATAGRITVESVRSPVD